MAASVSFKLASSHKSPLSIGGFTFVPGTVYTNNSFKMTAVMGAAIGNAFANGTLVFTDSTSLSEMQTNPVVAQDALDDNAASVGGRPVGSTATTPKLKLASTITTPLSVGRYIFKPNTTYQDAGIKMNDPLIVSAIARGLIQFADSNVAATVIGNPVAYAHATDGHALSGWLGAHNVLGV